MKNVAKCDTWCELQNPVNHRVFERKLRLRPFGVGHVCLGVMSKDTPHPITAVWTWCLAPRAAGRGEPKFGLPGGAEHSTWWMARVILRAMVQTASGDDVALGTHGPKLKSLEPRPQVSRDYPLNLSI